MPAVLIAGGRISGMRRRSLRGEEKFRELVEGDGKNVLRLSSDDQLELDWSASQCKTQTPGATFAGFSSAPNVRHKVL
jgi:hypothetical protein